MKIFIQISALLMIALATQGCNNVGFSRVEDSNVTVTGSNSYRWIQGGFGACNANACGVVGSKSQTVTCQRNDGATVSDIYCATTKPPTTQQCSQPCQGTYQWQYTNWSDCSVKCGTGTQTRQVTCQDAQNKVVSNSLCSGTTQQGLSQSCSNSCQSQQTVTSVPKAKVDILMVIDDSGSMNIDYQKLLPRMATFLPSLNVLNIDYNLCYMDTAYSDPNPSVSGALLPWIADAASNSAVQFPYSYVLNSNTPSLASIFAQTVTWLGDGGDGDERGIAQVSKMIKNHGDQGCIRSDAALAVVLISDEDEASIAGNLTLAQTNPTQSRPLVADDQPQNLKDLIQASYPGKPFVWNSIVVRSGDSACLASESAQVDSNNLLSVAFYGTFYEQMANITGGSIGSICDSDYGSNLTLIKNRIIENMPTVSLKCPPVQGTVSTQISYPAGAQGGSTWSVLGNVVTFNPPLPEGSTVTVNYQCSTPN